MTLLPRRAALVAALVLSAAPSVRAQVVDRVGPGAGLNAEMITAIFRDRTGFQWIGTRQGLYLFDGTSYRRFEHRPDEPESLPDNSIRTIFEDPQGRLWLGTNTRGLALLDRARWTFRSWRHDPNDERSLSHDSVNAIASAGDGTLWIATQRGLNRFDPASGRAARFLQNDGEKVPGPDAPAGSYTYALHVTPSGDLWVGTIGAGLSIRDARTGRFTHRPTAPAIFAILGAADGTTWLGTDRGLCRADAAGETVGSCLDPDSERDKNRLLVTSLAQVPDGPLWVGTLGGLFALDEGTRPLREFDLSAGLSPGNRASRIITMFADGPSALWIGTWENGLQRLRTLPPEFEALIQERAASSSATDVTAIVEDERGRTWLASSGGGLFLRAPGQRTFRPFEPLQRRIDGLGISMQRLAVDRDGRLWIGCPDRLMRVDPETGRFETFIHDPAAPGSLGPGYVSALAVDAQGVLWVGTGEGGLQRMREDGRTFDHFVTDPKDPASIPDNYVNTIREDRRGRLLIGTRSGGLGVFDRATGRFRRFGPVPTDPTSLSHHNVTAIVEDADGALWIGTGGGGVNRMLEAANGSVSFTRITAADGLADDNVMSIAPDDHDNLWIGTRDGLSRFDVARKGFRNYRAANGLPAAEFNQSSVWRGRTHFYFGTIKGGLAIARGSTFPAIAPSPIVITSVRTLTGALGTDRPAWGLERVSVRYGEALMVDFTVLDAGDPSRHRYAYRLGPSETEWSDLGPSHSVTFSKLDPGPHEFVARGRDDAGMWNETPHLVIEVIPPLWMTGWFRALGLLVIAAVVFTGHRVRVIGLERRNQELVLLQQQREAALAESRTKEEQLRVAYGNLRALTRRLELAKEDERKRIARELHDEMGQALTAAKITLDLVERTSGKATADPTMGETAALLQRIIDRVRDLSLDLRPPLLDERGLVAALRSFLESQSRRTGLTIEYDAAPDLPRYAPEIETAAFRVVQESVTNALRHAAAGWIWVGVTGHGTRLDIKVRDDGRGFDVDQVLAHAAAGRHLGLLGMRERVESLRGTLVWRSAPGQGTEVCATLPAEIEA